MHIRKAWRSSCTQVVQNCTQSRQEDCRYIKGRFLITCVPTRSLNAQ